MCRPLRSARALWPLRRQGSRPRPDEFHAARARVGEELSGLGVKLRKTGDPELDSSAYIELFAPETPDTRAGNELSRAARPFAAAKRAPGEEALAQAEMIDCAAVCWKRLLPPPVSAGERR